MEAVSLLILSGHYLGYLRRQFTPQPDRAGFYRGIEECAFA
jgi:hypothetical protein